MKLRLTAPVVVVVCLAILLFRFGPYIQDASFDLIQHYMLVNEIATYGTVRPEAALHIDAMALYPPAAHWMAVMVGWVGGSDLVGITLITVCSLFLAYIAILNLVAKGSVPALCIFLVLFASLIWTKSLVGWEVNVNFFYPQLVADAFYFAFLIWLSRERRPWLQMWVTAAVGCALMWMQPLVAVHVLAAGATLLAYRFVSDLKARSGVVENLVRLAVLGVAGISIAVLHPSFIAMRHISANDGTLVIGFNHVLRVAAICAALGLMTLWRCWRGRGAHVDVVLGCAVIAAALLCFIQFAALKLNDDGSYYAVKKHIFLLATLGALNAARLLAGFIRSIEPAGWTALLIPAAATLMTIRALSGFEQPVAPVVRAIADASYFARYGIQNFEAGTTVSADSALPKIANLMITLTALRHPWDKKAIEWAQGSSLLNESKFAMVERADARPSCNALGQSDRYVIVTRTCLFMVELGEHLAFTPSGRGWHYATSGWSLQEPWGAWSLGNLGGDLTMTLPEHTAGPLELVVDAQAWLTPQHRTQSVVVRVNHNPVGEWHFDESSRSGERSVTIPEEATMNGVLNISFTSPGSVSPAQLGETADTRVIGIGVRSVTLQAAKP